MGTHAARRTFVCNALAFGIPAEVIMKITGHSNLCSDETLCCNIRCLKEESNGYVQYAMIWYDKVSDYDI